MAGFGAYGKIPDLGDFFRINVASSFVAPWDRWLQNGMLRIATQLGADWIRCYMSAPIWRFTLSAGQAGPQPVVGVVMPSVDRVGRSFPLTLVAPLSRERTPAAVHFGASAMFEALEDAALGMLEDGASREHLASCLGAIPGPDTVLPEARYGQNVHPTEPPEHVIAAGKNPALLFNPSVWSAVLNGQTLYLSCDDLPDMVEMRGLFDMNAPIWSGRIPMGEPTA